jgi:hypothetical protein
VKAGVKAGASLQGCSAESGRSSQPDREFLGKDRERLAAGELYPFRPLPERDIVAIGICRVKSSNNKGLQQDSDGRTSAFSGRPMECSALWPFVNAESKAIYE